MAPAIRMNLLTEGKDVDALVRAVQRTREIISTEPIASAVAGETRPWPRLEHRGIHPRVSEDDQSSCLHRRHGQ
jgi:hypothetical protein